VAAGSEERERRRAEASPGAGILPGAALAATLVLWASSFPAIRSALEAHPPGELALLRFVIASVVLAAAFFPRGGRLLRGRDLPGLLAAGLAGVTVYQVLLGYGQLSVGSGAAAVLVDTAPIFTALFAALLLKERVTPAGWAGIVAAFCGALLIALGEAGGLGLAPGAPLLLVAAVALSAYFALQKPYLPRYGPLGVTTYAVLAGTVALLPFAPGLPETLGQAPAGATLAVVYLGVFPAAVAYAMWAYALSRLPVSGAASFLYLIPPLTFLISWTLFGEEPAPLSLAGAAVALSGVALANRRGSARRRGDAK
jgi:drug/metabolite transporter (DMT)-like permease